MQRTEWEIRGLSNPIINSRSCFSSFYHNYFILSILFYIIPIMLFFQTLSIPILSLSILSISFHSILFYPYILLPFHPFLSLNSPSIPSLLSFHSPSIPYSSILSFFFHSNPFYPFILLPFNPLNYPWILLPFHSLLSFHSPFITLLSFHSIPLPSIFSLSLHSTLFFCTPLSLLVLWIKLPRFFKTTSHVSLDRYMSTV